MTFSHVDDSGAARMVDVAGKDVTVRTATATGRVDLSAQTVALLRGEGMPKGDVLAVALHRGIIVADAHHHPRPPPPPPPPPAAPAAAAPPAPLGVEGGGV